MFRVYAEKDYELKLAVPYWAMSFDEFVSFTFGEISDNDRAQISDLVLKLKKLTIRENKAKFSYLNEELISVDSPIPFSFKRLFLYLYRVVFSTHTSKPAGQKLCDIDADFSIEDTTEAFSEDDAGNKRSGSIEPFILPQYLPNENQRIFLSNGVLNIKRQLLSLQARMSDPRYDFIFNPIDYVPDEKGNVNKDVDSLLESWVGDKQLSVFDVSGVPSSILIDIVGILLRLMYDSLFWSRNLPQGARNRPLLVIMEEAHNYLGTNNTNRASSIVRRLVKEGRKYGIGAMIVSQRPSEIDPTILSQCGTTISLRLTNSNDRGIVANTVSDNLSGLVNMLPILKTGESIIVGEAVRMPMRANISLPEEVSRPDSQDPRVAGENEDGSKLGWNQKLKVADDDYLNVSKTWRSQNVKLQ